MTKGLRDGEGLRCPKCGLDTARLPAGVAPPDKRPHADGTERFACPACKSPLAETARFDLWLVPAWQKHRKQEAARAGGSPAGTNEDAPDRPGQPAGSAGSACQPAGTA